LSGIADAVKGCEVYFKAAPRKLRAAIRWISQLDEKAGAR